MHYLCIGKRALPHRPPIIFFIMKVSKETFWRTSRDYFFITLGMAIYAFGFTAFILPEKVVIGGLAGLGTIIYFKTGIPVAISQ